MKLLGIGATGGVDSEIVSQAADRAHQVTAFVRAPERLAALRDRITVIQGDLLNSGALERVLEGQDVILSSFGPRMRILKGDSDLLGTFARVLTSAMMAKRIQRAIVVSTAFLFKDAIISPAHLVGRLFFPSVVSDATEIEDVIVSRLLTGRSCARPGSPANSPPDATVSVRVACHFSVSQSHGPMLPIS